MQFKTQWDITSHQSEWPSPKRPQIRNVSKNVEKREPLYIVSRNVNWCSHCGKQHEKSSKTKLNIQLLHDLVNPILGIYLKKMKTLIQKDTHTSIFKAGLFTITKIWKQPIWQSTNKCIKTWYLYTQGFPVGSNGKESACNAGDLASITGLGRSPQEGNGYPHQYSGLENSMDRGAWQATVHEVPKSLTRLQCGRPGFDPFIYIEHYWFTIITAILPFLTTRMDLECIKLSEKVRQIKIDTICYHSYVESKE